MVIPWYIFQLLSNRALGISSQIQNMKNKILRKNPIAPESYWGFPQEYQEYISLY